MIGKTVGDYRITDLLGEGGMGMVYRAVHSVVGQVVAIKALHPTLIANESVRKRFEREAQALARLNHPLIVRLLNYVTAPDGCYIVMEFTEGETIEDKLARDGKVPIATCLPWFIQTLEALKFAHDQGVIHRDIKPSNIMVGRNGGVKLLDFGTAKLVDAQGLTRQGMTLGTVIYMSPEQILGRELDHRSDLYSVAVTLFETATGQLPFYDDAEHELVKQIVKQAAQPPSKHDPTISPEIDAAILRALEKKPDDRFVSSVEFRTALESATGEKSAKKSGRTGKVKRPSARAEAVVDTAPTPPTGGPDDTIRVKPKAPLLGGKEPVLATPGAITPLPHGETAKAVAPGRSGTHVLLIGGGLGCLAIGLGAGLPLLSGGYALLGGLVLAVFSGAGVFMSVLGLLERAPDGGSVTPLPPPIAGSDPPQVMETASGNLHLKPGTTVPIPAEAAEVPADARGVVYVLEGPNQGSKAVIEDLVEIGRAPECALTLTDPGVSGKHCRVIRNKNGGLAVEDTGSRNGTYLNHEKVESLTDVKDGDEIIVGSSRLHITLKKK